MLLLLLLLLSLIIISSSNSSTSQHDFTYCSETEPIHCITLKNAQKWEKGLKERAGGGLREEGGGGGARGGGEGGECASSKLQSKSH